MNEIKCPHCGKSFEIDEAGYEAIARQVRGEEFERELHNRLELEVKLLKSESDKQVEALKSEVEKVKSQAKVELIESTDNLRKEKEELANQLKLEKLQKELDESKLKDKYDLELKDAKFEIERLRLAKSQQSVKIIGETLEQHCEQEFNAIRMTAFPRATFGKDSDIKTGTKGDYIFRDFDEHGNELISIMFEMKNESDDSENKSKNEDFLKKLDKNRNDKKCEYAVLVSVLERDSELYNRGIVDVSYKYPKMFVIRPQFFIPLISLLRNAALGQLVFRQKLQEIEARNIDIVAFENAVQTFKTGFDKWYNLSVKQFEQAIASIDASIDDLEKTKEFLSKSLENMRKANTKAQKELTMKKLTKGSPSLASQAKQLESGQTEIDEDDEA